jgi:hypothetical protein
MGALVVEVGLKFSERKKRQDTHFLFPVRGPKKSRPSETPKPSLTAGFFASLAVPATISAFNFVIGPRHSTGSAWCGPFR